MSGISVVVTVRDDRDALGHLLPALAAQSRPPDELVVVDGGSTDGTLELLEQWRDSRFPLRVLVEPGANISAGRNAGVRAAAHERIACTDAGCRPLPEWLSAIEAAFPGVDFVSGIYLVEGETPFERAVAAALYPSVDELERPTALTAIWQRAFGKRFEAARATGRSMAFSKAAWAAVGGFPEDRYTGEDTAFSLAVVERGLRAALVVEAAVVWRPRTTWRATARMFRTYARGDVRHGSHTRHWVRLGAWTLAPLLAVAGGRLGRAVLAAGGLSYTALPVARARRFGLRPTAWWRLPVLIAVKDLSQIAGAAQGFTDDLMGKPQPSPYGGRPSATERPGTRA